MSIRQNLFVMIVLVIEMKYIYETDLLVVELHIQADTEEEARAILLVELGLDLDDFREEEY